MAADLSDRLGVPKLGVDNYGIWSKKMRFALTVKGLWSAISDPEDPGNEKALAFIGLSLEDHNMTLIENCETAADAWDALKDVHQSSCIADALRLKHDLANLSMQPSEPVTKYVARAKTLRDNLTDAGYNIDDKDLTLAILGGLPKDYETIVTVLAEKTETPSINDLMAKLMLVEKRNAPSNGTPGTSDLALYTGINRRRGYNNMNGNNSGNNDSNGDDRACWYCGKKGHFKADCPKRKTACLSAVTEICL